MTNDKNHEDDLTIPHINRESIEKILGGMRPRSLKNYQIALVHSSFNVNIKNAINKGIKVCDYYDEINNEPTYNQRLEFVGDAIFNQIVATYLFNKFPNKDEGFLTRLRTKIVRDTHCVKFSNIIGLDPHILTGSIIKKNPEGKHTDKLLEDSFESFIAAIYLDLGYKFSNDFVIKLIEKHVDFNTLLQDDNYKDILMRYTQNKGIPLPRWKSYRNENRNWYF